MVDKHLNDLVLEIGDAGGEKRIQVSSAKMGSGIGLITHQSIKEPGIEILFGEGYAHRRLESSANGNGYALAELTDKGYILYEELQTP